MELRREERHADSRRATPHPTAVPAAAGIIARARTARKANGAAVGPLGAMIIEGLDVHSSTPANAAGTTASNAPVLMERPNRAPRRDATAPATSPAITRTMRCRVSGTVS